MSNAASRPWTFSPEEGRAPDGSYPIFGLVVGKDGHRFRPRIVSVAATGGPIDENDPDGNYKNRDIANANLIVKAVNNYDDLLSQLEEVDEILTSLDWHTDRGLLQRVRNTIAKAIL